VDARAALPDRAEYALLQASVRAEELQTRMKRGEYLPQAGIGVCGLLMKIDDGASRTLGMAFGTLSVPLSGWWEARHALEERALREDMARNTARDNEELLVLQMEKSWRDLEDAHAETLLADETRNQAEENLRVSRDGYAHGIVTLSDVLEAQAMLQKACDQWIDAKAACRVALLRYLQVTGR
jgi:outer membrane protein TolC